MEGGKAAARLPKSRRANKPVWSQTVHTSNTIPQKDLPKSMYGDDLGG